MINKKKYKISSNNTKDLNYSNVKIISLFNHNTNKTEDIKPKSYNLFEDIKFSLIEYGKDISKKKRAILESLILKNKGIVCDLVECLNEFKIKNKHLDISKFINQKDKFEIKLKISSCFPDYIVCSNSIKLEYLIDIIGFDNLFILDYIKIVKSEYISDCLQSNKIISLYNKYLIDLKPEVSLDYLSTKTNYSKQFSLNNSNFSQSNSKSVSIINKKDENTFYYEDLEDNEQIIYNFNINKQLDKKNSKNQYNNNEEIKQLFEFTDNDILNNKPCKINYIDSKSSSINCSPLKSKKNEIDHLVPIINYDSSSKNKEKRNVISNNYVYNSLIIDKLNILKEVSIKENNKHKAKEFAKAVNYIQRYKDNIISYKDVIKIKKINKNVKNVIIEIILNEKLSKNLKLNSESKRIINKNTNNYKLDTNSQSTKSTKLNIV